MAISLPKIETPTYQLKIPSTKKTLEFRPYLVAEEKVLMIALESRDENQIFNSVKKLVSACTFNKIDVEEITTFDLEYIFINLRAKSVGEIIEIKSKCEECGHENTLSVNLNEVDLVWPKDKMDSKIMLTDTIGITMRYPRIKDTNQMTEKSGSETMFKIINKCIESIFDSENVYSTSDYSTKQIEEFIDSLNHNQLEKITDFISSIPVLKTTIKYKCEKCGHESEIEVSGLQSFFS